MEAIKSGLIFNSIGFEGIKIGVVNLFPNTQKNNGILVSQPLLNKRIPTLKILHHIRERNIIFFTFQQNANRNTLHIDYCLFFRGHIHLLKRKNTTTTTFDNTVFLNRNVSNKNRRDAIYRVS